MRVNTESERKYCNEKWKKKKNKKYQKVKLKTERQQASQRENIVQDSILMLKDFGSDAGLTCYRS
jgi:hypothetical protein